MAEAGAEKGGGGGNGGKAESEYLALRRIME